jgi:RNA polymerase sigma-70 factor (ECF subfamily)
MDPFDEIYRQYSARVYRYCLTLVADPALAEDVTADTFVAAYAAYERVKPDPAGIKPWLFRIAHNRMLNVLRHEKVWNKVWDRILRQPDQVVSAEDTVVVRQELAEMLASVKGLKVRDRRILALRFGADLSFGEIGQVFGISENHASSSCNRALTKLRKHIEKQGGHRHE